MSVTLDLTGGLYQPPGGTPTPWLPWSGITDDFVNDALFTLAGTVDIIGTGLFALRGAWVKPTIAYDTAQIVAQVSYIAGGTWKPTTALVNDAGVFDFWAGNVYTPDIPSGAGSLFFLHGFNVQHGASLVTAGTWTIADFASYASFGAGAAGGIGAGITVTEAHHFWAAQNTPNAGTISLEAAFHSELTAGAGRFAFYDSGGAKSLLAGELELDGDLNHDGTNIGFYGTAPAAKQTVTGSRLASPALASLLTALATIGLITDSTTV